MASPEGIEQNQRRLNEELSAVLSELRDIMLQRRDFFRADAYRKAAEAAMSYSGDITDPIQLEDVPCFGPSILSKLKAYVGTGARGDALLNSEKDCPLKQLTKIHGVGPKTAQDLIDQGVTSIDDLLARPELVTEKIRAGLKRSFDLEVPVPDELLDSEKTSPLDQLTKIHGVGPKKAQDLIDQGVTSVDDLLARPELISPRIRAGLKKSFDIRVSIPEQGQTDEQGAASKRRAGKEKVDANDPIDIFTDGACSGNPGPGGWGVLLRWNGREKRLSGGEHGTTNNRMELRATIEALKSVIRPLPIRIYTDSIYVKDGITSWMPTWKKNAWKNSNKKPVKNRDLWEELDELVTRYDVSWHWVKGHSKHPDNDIADFLARSAVPRGRFY